LAFGKRRQPAQHTAPSGNGAPSLDSVKLELAKALREPRGVGGDTAALGRVPTSYGALLTASLAVVVIEMLFIMADRSHFSGEAAELAGRLADVSGRRFEGLTTLALMASVWSGARAVGMFALPAHFVLRHFGSTGVADYALAACGCSALFLAVCATLGQSAADPSEWAIGLAGGLTAGAVYRLVAGRRAL
jgi:hypothetical protein